MKTKCIRLPEDILGSLELVEEREHIEESSALRKLLRMGLETYLMESYAGGRITLREAAQRLKRSQAETMDLFLERGVPGNLTAADVKESMDFFLK